MINALHFLHECGLCHTSIKSNNILETSNGYVLSDFSKYYMYNNEILIKKGFKIPIDSVKKLKPYFRYKTDFIMLGDVLQDYLQNSIIKNPNIYIPIINDLKNADDNLNVFELLLKYNKIFILPIITVDTILNREYYKLAYYEYPIIADLISFSDFIDIINNKIDDENMKYYFSVCLLNKVSHCINIYIFIIKYRCKERRNI